MASDDVRVTRPPRRILIIKPSSLGDIVHALPVLRAIRKAHPKAHIAWLVNRGFAPLLEGHPLLDEVIPFDRVEYGNMARSLGALLAFIRFVRAIRRRQFDLVVDLQGLFRSGFLALASGAPRRVGFASAREFAPAFYSRRVDGQRHALHAVDLNLRLARAMGWPADNLQFPLGLGAEGLEAARALLAEVAGRSLGAFTAVIPGTRWESKRWRADRFAALIDRLASEAFPPVVVVGGPNDRAFADEILAACRSTPIDLVGRTSLRTLTGVIALAQTVVCHDSGPMHLAAALGKPVVALFGPTNPGRTGPYCDSAQIVALPLPCAPCYSRTCPLSHHNCMQQLDVEMVWQAILRNRPQPSAPVESPVAARHS